MISNESVSFQCDFTIQDLMKAGMHYGHLTRFRHPKMEPFIFTVRDRLSIIDLDQSMPLLKQAMTVMYQIASRGGKILFVGTKRAARDLVSEFAAQCHMPYVNYRWLGGMLTNYKTIKQSIRRLKDIEKLCASGGLLSLTKKEALTKKRELEKLDRALGGIKDMPGLPDAIFVIDVGQEKIAIAEANRLKIPVIGVVDSNASPENIQYVIPGNDDATRALQFYLSLAVDAITRGQAAHRGQHAGRAHANEDASLLNLSESVNENEADSSVSETGAVQN